MSETLIDRHNKILRLKKKIENGDIDLDDIEERLREEVVTLIEEEQRRMQAVERKRMGKTKGGVGTFSMEELPKNERKKKKKKK